MNTMSNNNYIIITLCFILCFGCKSNGTDPEPNNQINNEKYFGQTPPDLNPKVFAPGIISAGLFEYRLLIRPNSDEVYYEIWNKQTQKSQNYVLKWIDESWTNSQLFLQTNAFNEELGCFSSDGRTLYYSSNEPNGGYSYDIRYLIWENNRWSSTQTLGALVNTSGREQSPSVSANGNLYYYSTYNNTTGIYKSQLINDNYQQPEALGNAINNEEAHNPYIASDESFIIFTSYRNGGLGDADLYISFKNQDGTWRNAQNFGSPVNTSFQDDFASISPDGKYLFFASDRNSRGMADIYWVSIKIIDALKKVN